MNIMDRPYRSKKVVTDRKKLVAERKAKQAEKLKDRCIVCGDSLRLIAIRVGSVEHLCPLHFDKFLAAFHSFLLREQKNSKERPSA